MAPPTRRPRAAHTPAAERTTQFVRAALGLFAEHGPEGVQLADVSAAVGVSPNLIHHYFPAGRDELYRAAVAQACADFVAAFDQRTEIPEAERMPRNIATYLDQIFRPTPAYVLYAQAVHSPDPASREITERMRDEIADATALYWLGDEHPGGRTRAVLVGVLGLTETTAERWREHDLGPRAGLEEILAEILQATIAALRSRI